MHKWLTAKSSRIVELAPSSGGRRFDPSRYFSDKLSAVSVKAELYRIERIRIGVTEWPYFRFFPNSTSLVSPNSQAVKVQHLISAEA